MTYNCVRWQSCFCTENCAALSFQEIGLLPSFFLSPHRSKSWAFYLTYFPMLLTSFCLWRLFTCLFLTGLIALNSVVCHYFSLTFPLPFSSFFRLSFVQRCNRQLTHYGWVSVSNSTKYWWIEVSWRDVLYFQPTPFASQWPLSCRTPSVWIFFGKL